MRVICVRRHSSPISHRHDVETVSQCILVLQPPFSVHALDKNLGKGFRFAVKFDGLCQARKTFDVDVLLDCVGSEYEN